jgi:hypothetical protein
MTDVAKIPADPGFSSSSSHVFDFAANLTTIGRYCVVNGEANATQISSLSPTSESPAPVAGTITALGWHTATADGTTQMDIVINGSSAGIVSLSGATGAVGALSIAVAAGDRVALQLEAGTIPGNGNYKVFMA